jgi:hypothetical protein
MAPEQVLRWYSLATEPTRRRKSELNGTPMIEESVENMQLESQRFCGMAVTALASDQSINALSGKSLSTVGVAARYGYTDVGGGLPDACGFRERALWPELAD